MRQWLTLIFVFLMFVTYSQSGRKREHKNQGSGKFVLGFQRSPWKYKKTKPGRTQKREQPFLFKSNPTKNKVYRRKIIDRQNRYREKHRIRGNQVFHKRKYK